MVNIMKKTLIMILMLSNLTAFAEYITLDLSRSHALNDMLQAGLDLKEIPSGSESRLFTFKNQNIKIILPANRVFKQSSILGTFDVRDELLTKLSIYGDVMTHDDAVRIMKLFLDNFSLPSDQFINWEVENRGKVRDAVPYSISANLNFYPRVTLGLNKSMNGLYPWVVQLSISWDWDKHSDWDEERAWKELPRPQTPEIPLNPPSGQTYHRRDAYKDILKEQAAYERELTEQGINLPHLQPPPDDKPEIVDTDAEPNKIEDSNRYVLLIIMGGLVAIVMLGVLYFVKKKR